MTTAPKKKPATTRKRTSSPRKTTSTASTLGGSIGALAAGLILALVADLPWWAWLIIVPALLVTVLAVYRRTR
ncbi:hypothetical protein D5S17_31185 [Pseudonocardiaceae bacterium YIM PH 21723]|nr:hypothetical protein D5S17_31185 [Pseudonocardiaceae bacterium YIM PH 21723]